ncbi:MAG: hypothetical protein QXL47_02095 [Candidatus Anstonellales archaeon]
MKVDVEVKAKPSGIDRFVYEFVRILERYTNYALVSGYVAILLGMERPTQDIDVIVDGFKSKKEFHRFLHEIEKIGYSIAIKKEWVYEIFEKRGEKIDIFTKKQWYFDFKKAKNIWDVNSVKYSIKIKKGNYVFRTAPPEIQVPYKLLLGTDKDIKDAKYIYERLKDIIDIETMKKNARLMKVDLSLIV